MVLEKRMNKLNYFFKIIFTQLKILARLLVENPEEKGIPGGQDVYGTLILKCFVKN